MLRQGIDGVDQDACAEAVDAAVDLPPDLAIVQQRLGVHRGVGAKGCVKVFAQGEIGEDVERPGAVGGVVGLEFGDQPAGGAVAAGRECGIQARVPGEGVEAGEFGFGPHFDSLSMQTGEERAGGIDQCERGWLLRMQEPPEGGVGLAKFQLPGLVSGVIKAEAHHVCEHREIARAAGAEGVGETLSPCERFGMASRWTQERGVAQGWGRRVAEHLDPLGPIEHGVNGTRRS